MLGEQLGLDVGDERLHEIGRWLPGPALGPVKHDHIDTQRVCAGDWGDVSAHQHVCSVEVAVAEREGHGGVVEAGLQVLP